MKYAAGKFALAACVLASLFGCSQLDAEKARGPHWPGAAPTVLGSSGKELVTATIPVGVPSEISYQCWSLGLEAARKRNVDQDLSFREAAATMYACIAQRMPPDWGGRAAAVADVTRLVAYIHAKDSGFLIVPWAGQYQW
jgi:hypothetical protein